MLTVRPIHLHNEAKLKINCEFVPNSADDARGIFLCEEDLIETRNCTRKVWHEAIYSI